MKTALLVIDGQKFFRSMILQPLPNIKILNNFFNKTNREVVFTQHGHTKEELIPPIKNQLILHEGVDNVLMVNTEPWELVPDIWKMAKDAPIVAKNTYDAFINTDLDCVLKKREVERVVICGVMTDVCCETTARSAFCREYETWVVSDACWSDTQAQHDEAINTLEFLIGRVYTTVETIAMLLED